MNRLPLTVISGYLGAGKTTLINRLLAEDHGLRLLVMVNDFGAINIDAALIEAAGDDTISLTNGCVCCTMGADLFMALGDALDMEPRPDHLIIEASGIADPAAIANAARAEPELSYAGIVTLVDGLNGAALLKDTMIAPQIAQQMQVADLLLLTKTEDVDSTLSEELTAHGLRSPLTLPQDAPVAPLLFGVTPLPRPHITAPHPAYTQWNTLEPQPMTRDALVAKLETRPDGLYRLKGIIPGPNGPHEVHVVGGFTELRKTDQPPTGVVALGLSSRVTADQIAKWWEH